MVGWKEINQHHANVLKHQKKAIDEALEAGKILTLKKVELPHGEFKKGVKEYCTFSYRTAAKYMRLHKYRHKLDEPKNVTDAMTQVGENASVPVEERPKGAAGGTFDQNGKALMDKIPIPLTIMDTDFISLDDDYVSLCMTAVMEIHGTLETLNKKRPNWPDIQHPWADGIIENGQTVIDDLTLIIERLKVLNSMEVENEENILSFSDRKRR